MSGLRHGWGSDDNRGHADFVHGGVAPEDFEESFTGHPKRRQKRVKAPRQRGCSGNDFGPHVYVWTTESDEWSWDYDEDFFKRNGYYRREYKTCCGCGKIANSRWTEEMAKAIAKRGWYSANYG